MKIILFDKSFPVKNIFLTLKRSMQKIKQFHMVNGVPFVEIMDGLIGDQLHYRRLAVKLDVLLPNAQVFKTSHFTLTEQPEQQDSSLEMLQEWSAQIRFLKEPINHFHPENHVFLPKKELWFTNFLWTDENLKNSLHNCYLVTLHNSSTNRNSTDHESWIAPKRLTVSRSL